VPLGTAQTANPVPPLPGLPLEEGCLDADLKVRPTQIHKSQLKRTPYRTRPGCYSARLVLTL